MKMLFYIFLVIPTSISWAQLANGNVPIQKGNKWIYQGSDPNKTIMVVYIEDSTHIFNSLEYHMYSYKNGNRYYPIRFREDGFFVEKRDTSYHEPFNEMIFYKKGALIGDGWEQKQPWTPLYNYTAVVRDTFSITIFDTVVIARYIYLDFGLNVYWEFWTDEFGLIADGDFVESTYLRGCLINGKVYGDTLTTGIGPELKRNILPETIILFPNYPNPFNSSTLIRYQITWAGDVIVKIFDLNGKEVGVLFSGYQHPGAYSIVWNAESISSGVYMVWIKVGGMIKTQKVILIR